MPRLEDLPPELVADAVAKAVVEAVAGGGDTETIVARAMERAKHQLGLGDAGTDGVAAGPSLRGPVPAQPPLLEAPQPTTAFAPPPPSADGHNVPAAMGSGKIPGGTRGGGKTVITEGDVLDALRAGQTELRVAPGTIVTALGRDAARDAGLRLVEG